MANTSTPLILNIEAATGVCSVCLSKGKAVLSLHERTEQNEHSRAITLLIERCMADAGLPLSLLDAVAVSGGPGSYTSLRVGFSTAKGLCYALGKPLIVVDTLWALAAAAASEVGDSGALYCPMIDARRMEVYTALFDAGGNEVLPMQPMVLDSGSFGAYFGQGQRLVFCGNGAAKCRGLLNGELAVYSSVASCSASHLVSGAIKAFINKNFADIAYAAPAYLKPPNITSAAQKGG